MKTSFAVFDVDLSTDERTRLLDDDDVSLLFETSDKAESYIATLSPKFNHIYEYKELDFCTSCNTYHYPNNIYVMADSIYLCEECYYS